MINNENFIFGDQNLEVPSHLNFSKFMLNKLRLHNKKIALFYTLGSAGSFLLLLVYVITQEISKIDEDLKCEEFHSQQLYNLYIYLRLQAFSGSDIMVKEKVNSKTGEELTYENFTQYAVNLAHALHNFGIGRGDTVAFGSEKRNEYMPTALAIVFTGATFTPVEFRNGRATLQHKINTTKPRYFICTQLFWNNYKDILKGSDCIEHILTLDDEPKTLISVKSLISPVDIDIDLFEPVGVQGQSDVAFILYSSGTTGMSKGIMLTHENCILNSTTDYFLDESLKVAWIEAEWYHNYDAFVTCAFLTLGRKLVYHPEYTTETLVKNIHDYKVNIAMLVPSTAIFLSKDEVVDKYDMTSLKIIYSGSAPLHALTIDKINKRFPYLQSFFQRYGMTEIGVLTSEFWGSKGPRPGSNGMPSKGITLKIADPKTGEVLGSNQRGEICVRGPALMKGYVGIDRDTYMDSQGFFRTGDLGYYDEDHYFYIVDRLKEIINYNGYKVPPLELETLLLLHPGVREVGVVGKPHPDLTELPTAFVVRQSGSTVTENELIDFIASEVAHYMQLKGGVRFIDAMPRNPRKKILRSRLREMLEQTEYN